MDIWICQRRPGYADIWICGAQRRPGYVGYGGLMVDMRICGGATYPCLGSGAELPALRRTPVAHPAVKPPVLSESSGQGCR